MAEKKYEFEETMVTLVDEDGKEKPFYVDEMYMVKDQMYAALIPGDVENIMFSVSKILAMTILN